MTLTQTLVIAFLQILVALAYILILVPLTTFAERKVLGFIQLRLGATRVASRRTGFARVLNRSMWNMGRLPLVSSLRGLPFIAADIVKLLTKEDIVPTPADRVVFTIAPAISLAGSLVVFACISFYPGALFLFPGWVPIVGGLPFAGAIADLNVGLLFILAITSVGVYGIILGAWASNSKYPLLGGLRGAAQIVSYEVPLSLSLLVPVILSGSLNFAEMSVTMARHPSWWASLPMVAGFFIYLICGFAETNRLPFDMPEAENELVAGFHTEFTGMKFAFYYLAEYVNMIIVSALAAAFFLGGHSLLPFGLQKLIPAHWPLVGGPSSVWFELKILFILFCFIWVRGTIPRYRYDQVMRLGWKWLIPLSLVNLFLAALIRFAA